VLPLEDRRESDAMSGRTIPLSFRWVERKSRTPAPGKQWGEHVFSPFG
jgi:hypothetical protein